MASNEIELPLQTIQQGETNEPARIQDRARGAALAGRLRSAGARAKAGAASARRRLVRLSLEARAVARSSAALSGLSKDAGRVRAAVKPRAASASAGLGGVREDLAAVGRSLRQDFDNLTNELPHEFRRMRVGAADKAHELAARLKRAETRGKTAALRSSTISGLAIDSKRIVRRVKNARERRRMAH